MTESQAERDTQDAARYRFLKACAHMLEYQDQKVTFVFHIDSWPDEQRLLPMNVIIDKGMAFRQAQEGVERGH